MTGAIRSPPKSLLTSGERTRSGPREPVASSPWQKPHDCPNSFWPRTGARCCAKAARAAQNKARRRVMGSPLMLPQPPLLCEYRQMRIRRKAGVGTSVDTARKSACATLLFLAMASGAQLDDATRTLSRDIFRQLIEINTTDSVGSTTAAAEAMRQRLLDAGFAPADAQVL